MKNLTNAVLCVIVGLAILLTGRTSRGEEIVPVVDTANMSVVEAIDYIAPKFAQDPVLIKKIVWCESMNQVVVHDGGRGIGVTGLHRQTFNLWLPIYREEMKEELNYDSTFDQLKMISWAFSKGETYRDDWTSYRAYRNGGTYSFYSRTLGSHFTVKCK
jgi:hypothetical protein